MQCPECGATLIPNSHKSMPFSWRGRETMIDGLGDLCPECEEMVLSQEGETLVENQIRAFKAEQAAHVPAMIRNVREKLDLSQKTAGRIFGGGVNAFSRYEHGKSTPPLSLILLLQLLDNHPELMNEIRG